MSWHSLFLKKRTVAVLITVAAGVPAGYAIAQSTETEPGGDADAGDVVARAPGALPEGMNQVGTGPLPPQVLERVEKCGANEDDGLECGFLKAVASGDLKPGLYSDAELEAALADKGYSFTPNYAD